VPGFELTPLSFQPEIGSVSTPEYDNVSCRKTISACFQKEGNTGDDEKWSFHKFEGYSTLANSSSGGLYDSNLRQTGGYWGVQPVVRLVNKMLRNSTGLRVSATVYPLRQKGYF